jgi:hypothetical protein
MSFHAEYFVIGLHQDFVGTADANQGGRNVTDDAERVVHEVLQGHQLLPKQRLLYRDTLGRWDELVHDGHHFTGFRHIGGDSFVDAVHRARGAQGAHPRASCGRPTSLTGTCPTSPSADARWTTARCSWRSRRRNRPAPGASATFAAPGALRASSLPTPSRSGEARRPKPAKRGFRQGERKRGRSGATARSAAWSSTAPDENTPVPEAPGRVASEGC